MIQTETKALGNHEHEVRARLPRAEYDRVFKEKMADMQHKVRLPGFRPGKVPPHVIRQQFGTDLHHQVAEELIRTHYETVIEQSGLTPAIRPELDLPAAGGDDFEFVLKITTWPSIDLKLDETEVERLELVVEESDIEAVVDRMMKNNARFVADDKRKAEEDDQLVVDFVGSIDGVPFDGGSAEGVKLVLGEGRFIPGFEEQLIGVMAGDERTLKVRFPDDYNAPHLAGKDAEFAVVVHEVGRPEAWDSPDALAESLGFDDAEAMRASVRNRLEAEASEICDRENREAVVQAILSGTELNLPEGLIQEQIRANVQRMRQELKQRGVPLDESQFDDDLKQRIRESAVENLSAGAVMRSLIEAAKIEVSSTDVQEELNRIVSQYPEDQRAAVMTNIRSNKAQMEQIEDMLTERACVAYALGKMKVTTNSHGLSAWQDAQDAQKEDNHETETKA